MSKPRTVSSELPPGLLFQKGSASLYVIVPSPDRGSPGRKSVVGNDTTVETDLKRSRAVIRKTTGIQYDGLETDAQRADAISRGSEIVRLLDGMVADPRYHDVLRDIRSGTMSIREVAEVGLTDGRHALKERSEMLRTAKRDIDLRPFVDAFAKHGYCLHPNSAKRGKTMRPSTRVQQVSHVRRYLTWAAESQGLPADETAARPISLLKPAVFAPYLSVITERTIEERRRQGQEVDKDTGARAARDAFGAMSQFRRFLAEHLQLADVPDVTAGPYRPNATKRRDLHITFEEVRLLVTTLLMAGELEAAVHCAIMHSSALDTTDVATMRAKHLERSETLWHVHGTSKKTKDRARRVPMYPGFYGFVGAYVDERVAVDGPSARLFPASAEKRIERDLYLIAHDAAIVSLVQQGYTSFDGYQPRDSRHTLAVAMAKAGLSARIIGLQLGTAEETIVRVYAQWLQSDREWQVAADLLQGKPGGGTARLAQLAPEFIPPRATTRDVTSHQALARPASRRGQITPLPAPPTQHATPS
jgi:integrase